MATRFPLQSLLEQAQHRMEAAERLLRILKHKEDLARQRLDDLIGYRSDYRTRLTSEAGEHGLSIHVLRDFHAFLAKLEVAIRHQEGEVGEASAHWQKGHEAYLEQRQKVQAYETLAERHRARELHRQEVREQRQSDELASRHHRDRQSR